MTSTATKITVSLPNTPEVRSVLRRLADRCFEEQARPALSYERREAWGLAGTALMVAIEPEQLDACSDPEPFVR